MKYPPRYPIGPNARAVIRAAEILAAVLGFLFGRIPGLVVAFALILVNELTGFAPVRGAIGLFYKDLSGGITPRGHLKTRPNKNLSGSVRPSGELKPVKVPRALEYKGYIATISVDRPGNGFKGSVPDTDIRFTADLVEQIRPRFESAVDLYLELRERPGRP